MDFKLLCARCGNGFVVNALHLEVLTLHQIPRTCPVCCDRKQQRPPTAAIVAREMIQDWDGVEIAIPIQFFHDFLAQAGDRICQRAILKGSMGQGKSWSGRIDIYDFRRDQSELGRVRRMRATHQEGTSRNEIHGLPMGDKRQELIVYSPTYEYLAIDPATEPVAAAALVFPSVEYKKTIKGYGRQYQATLDASRALYALEMSSSARSGRFGTRMAVAVVNDEHPVYATQTGDVKTATIWSLSAPWGMDAATAIVGDAP